MGKDKNRDRRGRKYLDPTKNVLGLVKEATKRVEDLKIAEFRRIDDLREAETRRVNELITIRAIHEKEIHEKESNRLDSIRQVDVLNQAAAAKSALDAIQALAVITTTNADNIRNTLTATNAANAKQVADLASSIAVSTAASFDAQAVRVAALEKASAEGVGKGRVIDPQLDELLREMKSVRESRSVGIGETKGRSDVVGWIIGGIMFIVAIATFILANLKP